MRFQVVSKSKNDQFVSHGFRRITRYFSTLFKRPSFIIVFFTLGLYLLCLNSVWSTDHATSFLQLDWSIWKNHSFVLGEYGQFVPNSADDFLYYGYYYSALAPGSPVMALPLVALGFLLNGSAFSVYGYPMLLSEFFIALMGSIGALLVYKIGRMFFRESSALFLSFAYAFSTIAWPFATYFFQSDASATLDLLVAFLAFRIGKEHKLETRSFIFCGLAISTALTVDYVNAILIPIILIYLALSIRETRKDLRIERLPIVIKLVGFVLVTGIGIILIGLYNYVNFGSIFTSSEQLYLGSSTLFGNFTYPLYRGLILNLFTPFRGLFIYCPVLLIGLFGFYRIFRVGNQATLFLALFFGLLLPYSAWYDPTGGLSYGPRFIVPAIPFILLPTGFVLDARSDRWKDLRILTIYTLYVLGTAMNGIAAITSALGPADGPWLSSPFFNSIGTDHAALSNFLNGSVDAWSAKISGTFWWLDASLVILIAVFVPIAIYNFTLQKEENSEVFI